MLKHLKKLSIKADNTLKYGLAAILIVVPLYPKFPFINIPGTQVAIRLEDLLIFSIFFIWLIAILPNIKSLLKNKILIAMLIFWLVGLVSIFSGIFVTQTISSQIGLLHWVRRVEYMSCFLIASTALKNRKDLAFFVKILAINILAIFIYSLGQKYLNWPVITTQNAEYSKGIALRYVSGSHLISTFAGHYDLATYMILTTPLFIILSLGSKLPIKTLNLFKKTHFSQIIFLLLSLISVWSLVNAASRISIASYLGSAVLALIFIRKFKYIPFVVIVSIAFIGLSSNLIDRYVRIIKVTTEKVFEIQGDTSFTGNFVLAADTSSPARRESTSPSPEAIPVFEDRSTSIRLNVEWPRALRALQKNPLLGTGYSSITLATDNDYLRMLGEVGLLGTFSFFLIFFRIVFELMQALKRKYKPSLEKYFALAILASIPGVMLNMVFIDVLEASKFAIVFWILLGLSVSSVQIMKNE